MLHRAASLLDMKTTELYSLKEHGGFTCDIMRTGYDIFTICDGKMGIFVHVDIVEMENNYVAMGPGAVWGMKFVAERVPYSLKSRSYDSTSQINCAMLVDTSVMSIQAMFINQIRKIHFSLVASGSWGFTDSSV